MRPILHVDTERGWRGGQNQVYLLHRGLVAAGAPSTVLCRAGEPLAERLAAEGLPFLTVPLGFAFQLRAAAVIRKHAVAGALIHAHASAAHGIALLGVVGTKAPLLVTRRLDFALKTGAMARWKYGPRVTRFIAISQAVARILMAGGVTARQVMLIPDGIDPPTGTPAIAVPPTNTIRTGSGGYRYVGPAPIVLCAAAFAEHKGHRHLLEAWRLIEARGVPGELHLAGQGELETDLRTQAEGLRRVKFLGWIDDLPTRWAGVTLAVLASVEEGLGSVLIEAQLAGVPVVATTAGGIPDVVAHGFSGLLVPPGNPVALADALERLLRHPAERVRLANGAVRQAQGFRAEIMVTKHLTLYRELAP